MSDVSKLELMATWCLCIMLRSSPWSRIFLTNYRRTEKQLLPREKSFKEVVICRITFLRVPLMTAVPPLDASLVILMPGSKKDGKPRLKYFQMHILWDALISATNRCIFNETGEKYQRKRCIVVKNNGKSIYNYQNFSMGRWRLCWYDTVISISFTMFWIQISISLEHFVLKQLRFD